mgnify:CR=1 FL=1
METLGRNPLAGRDDLARAFEQLCEPLLTRYSPGGARLRLGAAGASFPSGVAELEGFSRVLWGLAPYLAGGRQHPLRDVYVRGLANGTDPAHAEYWGEAADYDQRLVEMAAIGFALALAPDQFWDPLDEAQRRRLIGWLDQINLRELYDCNWLLFAVLVNLGFRRVGAPVDRGKMERCLDRIEEFYRGDGWYADGPEGHCDYYVPFAIHFYCLLYAKWMETEDPARAGLYKRRAEAFARDFAHWFAADGSALPFGRSLTYRFAQCAFWGACAWAGIEPLPMGVMKGIVLRHLRWWFRRPIFAADGTLTVGYAYPNLVMAENYNSPGSPYWALKAFLPLALPPDHPFWTAPELPLPELPSRAVQRAARLVIVRPDNGHVLAFNGGHRHSNEHTHTFAKYEKFVYSTAFGFSVPRASWGLAQGAYDSTLALSERDNLYRVKRTHEDCEIDAEGRAIRMTWKPWADVTVTTWLFPGAPWHVRVHRVESARPLDAADGGFALALEPERSPEDGPVAGPTGGADGSVSVTSDRRGGMVRTPWGASGIRVIWGEGEFAPVWAQANTNVLHPRTVIPTVRLRLEPGVTWLATAVFGEPEAGRIDERWRAAPSAERTDGNLVVVMDGVGLARLAMD